MSTNRTLIYAGIGARATPANMLTSMERIGEQLSKSWLLRSGYADGADQAFGRGAESGEGSFQLILPWEGFNNAPYNDDRFVVPDWTTPDLLDLAEKAYNSDPEVMAGRKRQWRVLNEAVRLLMTRNVCQVLGLDLQPKNHAQMVICWTPNAASGGGTGQAIRIANMFKIPVFDLASEYDQRALCEFTQGLV